MEFDCLEVEDVELFLQHTFPREKLQKEQDEESKRWGEERKRIEIQRRKELGSIPDYD